MAPWQRLIRFETASGETLYGDPSAFLANGDLPSSGLRAHVVQGGLNGQVTDRVVEVAKILSPLPKEDVPIVPCIGLNYRAHAAEAKLPVPDFPVLFQKPSTAVTGPGPISIPPVVWKDPQLDYEGELGVVIGKGGKNIPLEKALDHVAGYVVANDVSARKWQRSLGGQFCYGKVSRRILGIFGILISEFDDFAFLTPGL